MLVWHDIFSTVYLLPVRASVQVPASNSWQSPYRLPNIYIYISAIGYNTSITSIRLYTPIY